MAVDPVREYVASKIARYERVTVHVPDRRGRMRPKVRYQKVKDGWTPIDVIEWAKDREADDLFVHCAIMVALCQDEKARAMPEHAAIHFASGIVGCVGPAVLAATARSLGISDDRAWGLIQHLANEWNATQGLIGGGSS